MENLKLEVKSGYLLEVSNHCYSRGCHYPEDDWSVKVIESTVEECIEKFWKEEYNKHEIYVSGIFFSKVEYVTYNGRNIVLTREDTGCGIGSDLHKLYISQFNNHPYKETAIKIRADKAAAEKKAAQEKAAKEFEEKEIKKYLELKEKYDKE